MKQPDAAPGVEAPGSHEIPEVESDKGAGEQEEARLESDGATADGDTPALTCEQGTGPKLIQKATKTIGSVAVVNDEDGYGVVWRHGASIYFKGLDAQGEERSESRLIYDGSKSSEKTEIVREPLLFWTGDEYILMGKYQPDKHRCWAAALLLGPDGQRKSEVTSVIKDICAPGKSLDASWNGERLIVSAVDGYQADGIRVASLDPSTMESTEPVDALAMKSVAELYPLHMASVPGKTHLISVKLVPGSTASIFHSQIGGVGEKIAEPELLWSSKQNPDLRLGLFDGRGAAAVVDGRIIIAVPAEGKGTEVASYAIDGDVIEEFHALGADTGALAARLFWDGKLLWLVWLGEKKKGKKKLGVHDVLAAPLSSTGQLLAEPVHISETTLSSGHPVSVSGSNGRVAVVWANQSMGGGLYFSSLTCN